MVPNRYLFSSGSRPDHRRQIDALVDAGPRVVAGFLDDVVFRMPDREAVAAAIRDLLHQYAEVPSETWVKIGAIRWPIAIIPVPTRPQRRRDE